MRTLPRTPIPAAPKHLSAEAKRLWRDLVEEYGVSDSAGLAILAAGLEAHDRMRQAQATLACDGATVKDRFGQTQVHPAVRIERDSRSAWLAALKSMNFDLQPLGDVGRPPGPQLPPRRRG
jgi:P27 family predicted phage terminase small subunit